MSDTNWITDYYQRLQGDYQISFTRRDNITNWTYAILAAIVSIYFGFFNNNLPIEPVWRFSFLCGMLVIMIRFLFQSMIAYGYLLRVRYLRTQIETYWLGDNPNIDDLKKSMRTYDHGRHMPPIKRNRFWDGEVRSGFIINIAVPVILILNELHIAVNPLSSNYCAPLAVVAIYTTLEIINYLRYDQMRTESKS